MPAEMETETETADDEDPPVPFDPSEFEGGEEKSTNNIMETTTDYEDPPVPFDPSKFEGGEEKSTNNIIETTTDYEDPPRPFDPCEFELGDGAEKMIHNNMVPIPPPREGVNEEQDRSLSQSSSGSGRGAVFPNNNDYSRPPPNTNEESTWGRRVLSLGAESGTPSDPPSARCSLRSDAPRSRYAIGENTETVDDD